jgi:beta-aspartyl-peptidase (threonine type)
MPGWSSRRCASSPPGQPLDWAAIQVTGIGPDSTLDLNTLRVTAPAFAGTASVKGGRLSGVPYPADAAGRSPSTAAPVLRRAGKRPRPKTRPIAPD